MTQNNLSDIIITLLFGGNIMEIKKMTAILTALLTIGYAAFPVMDQPIASFNAHAEEVAESPFSVKVYADHAEVDHCSKEYDGEIIIPEVYEGLPVTSIGISAFEGCSGLTTVTIPDSVTSIGDSAFSGCSGLTTVTIPGSVTSIGDCAFVGCSGLTTVTIQDSVTSIGAGAFENCSGLTTVTIPDSVTSIGYSAFRDCKELITVTIPDSVTSIGEYAFVGCDGLITIYGYSNSTAQKFAEDNGYKFEVLSDKPVAETPCGDINADDVINSSDIIMLTKYILAVPGTELKSPEAADINKDGTVNVMDLIALKNIFL